MWRRAQALVEVAGLVARNEFPGESRETGRSGSSLSMPCASVSLFAIGKVGIIDFCLALFAG